MKKRMAVLALFSMIFLTTAYAIPASAVTVDPMTSRKSISGKIVLPNLYRNGNIFCKIWVLQEKLAGQLCIYRLPIWE